MAIKTSAISSAKNAVSRAKTAAEKKKEEEEKRLAQEARNRKSTDTKANSGKSGTKAISAVAKQAAETAVRRVEAETGQTATKEAKDAVTRAAKKAAKAATEQVKQVSATKTTEKKGLATGAAKSTFQKISERIAASEPGKQSTATEKGMQNILARYRFADDLDDRTAQRQENILNNREGLTSTGAAKELLGTDKFLSRWSPYSPTSMTYLPPAYLDRIAKDESLAAKGFGLGSDKVSYADILAATALDPLSAMKADSKSNAFFGRGAGMKSKPWTEGLTDTEKIKEGINRLAEQQKKERRARAAEQQSLSPYDQKLRAQFRQEIRNAKADYDSAKARGDAPGMVEAHRRAETWRRLEGGYSGGTAGDEYISPELDNADISLLNKTGQTQLKAAKLGYENAQSDEERARYAAMGQDIRRNPFYLKPVHDRGAYRETDAEGRMRYAGTAEERQKEKEQLAAVPAAIGTGVAGSFLSIPGTTARALQTDAARNQAALQNLSDIRGGGEVNISEPERRKTAQEKLDAFLASERYQKASPTAKANLLMYALRDINKETPLNERLLNRANFYREKATEGQKGLERYLTEALITGGEMIPGLAATALSGGAAAPGLAVMGTQAAGRRMGELEAAGEDPVRAFNRGVVTGLIEAGTELIPLRNLTKIARGGGDSFARNLLAQAIEEAGTEVASDYLNYGADKAFRDLNATRPTLQDVKDTAIISALTSLGMGAGAGIIGARRTGRQNAGQPENVQQAADNLRQAAADLEASQARTRAMREEMRGQQPETAGAESFARREQDIQVRTELWNRRINRTLDRLANAGEDQTYRAHLERELAQQQQEGRDLLAERDRLRQDRTRTEEAQQIAEESRYRADRARETGAELAADVTARINARAQEARDRLDREEVPVFTAMRDALRGAAAERTEAARQTEPGFSPLQPPRERTAEAPPVTEKETERKHSPGYNTAENHIDNRQTGDVYLGDRNVKAFQWDHPEVKPFFKKAAAALKRDVEYADSTKHSQRASNIQRARGKKAGTVMEKNDVIRKLMDRGLSTTDIIKACDAIINDEGQENYAAAKRVELALDDMLSKGYTPTDSGYKAEDKVAARVAPDAEYLAVKDRIAGAVKQGSWERYLRDNEAILDWGEVTEDELRAEWEALQAQPQEATEAARPTEPEPRTFASFEEEMADLGSRVNSLIEEWQEARRTRPEDQEAEAYYREQAQQVPVIEQAIREKWGRAETPEPEPTPYARREEPPVREEEQARYSVGAAPGGFDAFSDWQNESDRFHPINEKAYERTAENRERAQVEVPVFNRGGRRVSKAFSTLVNANVVPNEILPTLENKAANGEYAYEVNTDQAAKARARDYVERNGFMQAYADWQAQRESGKYGKDNTALGLELANQAMNSGTEEGLDFGISLATDLIHATHDAASAMQAWGMINRLSPTGQLFSIAKTVDKINQDAAERRQKSRKKQTEFDFLLQSREDALDIIRTMANEYRAEYDKPPQEIESGPSSKRTWVEQLGAELAKNLSGRLNTPTNTPVPIAKTILGDLVKFAEEHAIPTKPKSERRTRTAADRITDYFNNREEYNAAWQLAQKEIRERYKENENDSEEVRQRKQEARDAFEDWLNSTISYNAEGSDATMLRAILDSSKEFDNVPIRSEYDRQAITEDIYNQLNRQVQAEGPDATILHNAVERWVNEKALDSGTANEKKIGRDIQKAMRTLGVKMSDLIRKGAKTKEGVAQKITQMLTEEYGISEDGAAQISEAVLEQYNQAVKEASERALASKFKTRNGRRAKTALEHLEELANLGAFTSDEYSSLASEKVTGYKDAKIDPELARQFVEAQDQTERDQIAKEIYKDIARQVPPTWADKFNAFRYVSMLGNPRTQVRNIVGNLGFQPVRIAKNAVGTALERAAKVDQSQRTKSVQFKALSKADRARYQAGLDEYDQVESVIMGNGKYNDSFTDIDKYRRIFKSRFLEGWRNLTNAGLEQGDVFFAKRTYADSLAGILKARGITAEEYKSSSFPQEAKEEIRAIAVTEAQKATYRDLNKFSKWVNSLGKGPNTPKAVHYLTEGLLPFKKTPANVLVRGIEYSPVGLLNGIKDMATKVKSGEMTAAEGLDEIASGLTGTGLLGLGILLASMGLVTPGADEDDKQKAFDELLGKQSYALNLPGGYSVTLDWMAPEAIPFFMGVEALNSWDNIKTGEKGKDVAWNALRRISDPVLEMSMMQGVNDLIENVSYSDNKAMSILATLATGYLSQYIPTIGGQIERTLEDRRYSTWIDRDSWVPNEIQYLLAKNANKIPGLEYHQREYLNAWGEPEMTGSPLFRALSNFASPGYIKKKRGGEVEAELQRLYDAGFDNVLPSLAKANTKVNGEFLAKDQYNTLIGTEGKESRTMLEQVINSPEYKGLSDEEKAAYVKKIFDFSRQEGKLAAGMPEDQADSYVLKAREGKETLGLDPADFLALYVTKSLIDKDETEEDKTLKAVDFNLAVDARDDLNEEQKAFIKDNIKFFNMYPVSTESFDRAINAGLSVDQAKKFLSIKDMMDTNENGNLSDAERVAAIKNSGEPEEVQEMMWEAAKTSDDKKNWQEAQAAVQKAEARAKKIEAVRSQYLKGMDQSMIDAFDAAADQYGTGSYRNIYDACMSVSNATMAERNQYYLCVSNQREKPWSCTTLSQVNAYLKKHNK